MTIKEEIQIEEYKRAFAEAYKQGFIDAMSEIKRYEYSIPEACKSCSNHPSNGGSGICHCTLGTPPVKG